MIEKDDKVRVYAIPATTGGSRAFCDRAQLGSGRGTTGTWLHLLPRWRRAGPIAKNIGEDRTNGLRDELGLEDGDASFLPVVYQLNRLCCRA